MKIRKESHSLSSITSSAPYALIVDDDRLIRETISDALMADGFDICTTDNGYNALELIAMRRPDVIFLDIIMPHMTGYETCKWIRKLPDGDHIPIIMMTGSSDDISISKAFDAGATDFTCKPLNYALLGHKARYSIRSNKALEEARRTGERLEKTQQVAKIGSWDWIGNTGGVTLSRELMNILGLHDREEQVSFKNALRFINKSDRRVLYQKLYAIQVDHKPFDITIRLELPNKKTGYFRNRTETLFDNFGKFIGLSSFLQDVSETTHDKEYIHILSEAIESLPMGITITDKSGRITYTNPAEAEMHGYTTEELIGKSPKIFTAESCTQRESRDLDNWSAWTREKINKRRSNETFPIRLTSIPVRNHSGEALGMVSVSEDITAEKAAAEKSEQSEKIYHKLFGSSPTPILLISADSPSTGMIAVANQATAETFGYTPDEVKDLSISALFHCKESDFVNISSNRDFKIETKGKTKNGELLDLELATDIVTINEVDYFLVIANDITTHKKTEELLTLAKDRSEHANQLKQDFIATVNHELRTPLNGILGMLQLMEDTPLSEEQSEYISIALSSGENLLYIINQTLNFSKIEAGKQDIKSAPFNLEDAVHFLQDIFKQKLLAKNLQFTYHIAPDVPLNLHGDTLLLRQILMNLVGNSIKFTEQGEIQVQVQSEELTMNRIRLFFSIVDTGVGIPANKIDTILEPFSQADNSMQQKSQGTGLGLSIVKSLIEMMDGSIDIESNEGRGTKVNISIVLQTSPPETPASSI